VGATTGIISPVPLLPSDISLFGLITGLFTTIVGTFALVINLLDRFDRQRPELLMASGFFIHNVGAAAAFDIDVRVKTRLLDGWEGFSVLHDKMGCAQIGVILAGKAYRPPHVFPESKEFLMSLNLLDNEVALSTRKHRLLQHVEIYYSDAGLARYKRQFEIEVEMELLVSDNDDTLRIKGVRSDVLAVTPSRARLVGLHRR
jgi:hypothetical protein